MEINYSPYSTRYSGMTGLSILRNYIPPCKGQAKAHTEMTYVHVLGPWRKDTSRLRLGSLQQGDIIQEKESIHLSHCDRPRNPDLRAKDDQVEDEAVWFRISSYQVVPKVMDPLMN